MESEKEIIKRKLDAVKESLTKLDTEISQLEDVAKKLSDAQKNRQYLLVRIEKLTKMLKG